jgi:hypothetical protein
MARGESEGTSVAAEAAQQLEDILQAIDGGRVTASATQRAYLTGASHALKELARALSDPAEAPPSGAA